MAVIHNNDNNFIPYIGLAVKNIKSGRMPVNRKHTRSHEHLQYNVFFSQQSFEYFFKNTDYYNDVGCGGVSGSSMTDPSLKQFPSANPPPLLPPHLADHHDPLHSQICINSGLHCTVPLTNVEYQRLTLLHCASLQYNPLYK